MYADPEGWKEHFGAEEDCLTHEMMQLFRKGIQALQKEHDTLKLASHFRTGAWRRKH